MELYPVKAMRIGIVGAGISGLVSALMFAKAGHSVVLYEKEKPAAGASGKALGVLVPSTLQRPVDSLQREGIAMWPELAATLEKDTGISKSFFWREWEHPERPGCQQVRLPFTFEVLQQALISIGVTIETSHVIQRTDIPMMADAFDMLVLAAGYGNKELADISMTLSAGQAIKVRPRIPLSELILRDNLYICPDWDDTVRIGSISWDIGEDGPIDTLPHVTESLYERAVSQVPALSGSEIVDEWIGARPVSVPRLPLVYQVSPYRNVWCVAGLGKIGVGLSPVVGKTLLNISHTLHA